MEQTQAREIITTWAREYYGKLLEVREIITHRRALGRVWIGKLYCLTKEGDVFVGESTVDENGKIISSLNVDQFIDSLVTVRTSGSTKSFGDTFGNYATDSISAEMDFSSVSEDSFDDLNIAGNDDLDPMLELVDPESLQQKANMLIASGEKNNMLEARNILPRLLSYQQKRGEILEQMGELELLLGNAETGLQYLEAAAREYADLANLDGLSQVAELTMQITGEEKFYKSVVKSLFDQTRIKLRPLENIGEAPLFVGLKDEELNAILKIAKPVKVKYDKILLKEGEPANTAFIIQSGVASICVESENGSTKIVRSCFPGDFIGESSVLGSFGATCTATVKTETDTELWQFKGEELKKLGAGYEEIISRIASARTLHQLDSFISTNESTSTLDVSMRDRLLGCITAIKKFPENSVLNSKGKVPQAVYLIVEGQIIYKTDESIIRKYSEDEFAGLRDTLHQLPLKGYFIAETDCLLVVMDPQKLLDIAHNASPEIIAVLEKLE
jgi:CRP-like cAMP-binding protein